MLLCVTVDPLSCRAVILRGSASLSSDSFLKALGLCCSFLRLGVMKCKVLLSGFLRTQY